MDPQGLPVEVMWEYQFRLILIGDSTVGKSSLLRRFCDGKFVEFSDPTVGIDFFARLLEVSPGVRVKLQLWDTAGQERFRSITTSYYRNSVGGMLVYDIANRASFEHLQDWLEEAYENVNPDRIVFMVVGHKSDMDERRQVLQEEGERFAEAYGMKYMETSAKTCHNVEEAFQTISSDIYDKVKSGHFLVREGWEGVKCGFFPRQTLQLEEPDGERQKICC